MHKIRNVLLALLSSSMILIPSIASADTNNTNHSQGWYVGSDEKDLKQILELKFDDFKYASKFINDQSTFISANVSNGKVSFFWNSPNISSAIVNDVESQLRTSGYGTGIGTDVRKSSRFISLPDNAHAKTAMEKYGFSIPSPTYNGEKPLITINVNGVVIPQKPVGFIAKIGSFFRGKVNSLDDYKDQLKSLTYLSPQDYSPSTDQFSYWIKNNWQSITTKGNKHYINGSQIINTNASHQDDKGNADGTTDGSGKVWVMENLVYSNKDINGLDPNTQYNQIYQELKEYSGDEFPNVVKGIVLASGITNNTKIERQMPYDLKNMNKDDAKAFNGISDPRVRASEGLSVSWLPILKNEFLAGTVLKLSGYMAQITVALNRIGSFGFMEGIGINPTKLWDNTLIRILIDVIVAMLMFKMVGVAFSLIKSQASSGQKIIKLINQTIFIAILSVFALNPNYTYNTIKTLSNDVFTLSNVTLTGNEQLKPLYGNGNSGEKEDTTLWLPYFNTWTTYQTGQNLNSSKSIIDLKSGQQEVDSLHVPAIDGVNQNQWSTILADNWTNTGVKWSGDIYRTVDHFLAPRIDYKLTEKTNGSKTNRGSVEITDVRQNGNYSGPLQSKVDLAVLVSQTFLLFMTFIKALLFIEFFMNLVLIFYRMIAYINNANQRMKEFKTLFASMFNVFIANTLMITISYMSMLSSGFMELVIVLGMFFLVKKFMKWFIHTPSIFRPRSLVALDNYMTKFKGTFRNDEAERETQKYKEAWLKKHNDKTPKSGSKIVKKGGKK